LSRGFEVIAEREAKILNIIVEYYIKKGEPVGLRSLKIKI